MNSVIIHTMKTITQEQIASVLQVVYQTNISAQSFDILKKFFNELPNLEIKPDQGKTE